LSQDSAALHDSAAAPVARSARICRAARRRLYRYRRGQYH